MLNRYYNFNFVKSMKNKNTMLARMLPYPINCLFKIEQAVTKIIAVYTHIAPISLAINARSFARSSSSSRLSRIMKRSRARKKKKKKKTNTNQSAKFEKN